jgi:hypothetical protein
MSNLEARALPESDSVFNYLADMVSVPPRFHRSVRVSDDLENRSTLAGYLVSQSVVELATTVASSIKEPDGARAWSIVGPYGAGKSAFGVFLLDLLSRQTPYSADAQTIRAECGLAHEVWKPVVVIGQRRSFNEAIAESLLKELEPDRLQDAPKRANLATLGTEVIDDFISRLIELHGNVVLLIDEFGKFLEQSVFDPLDIDLMVLQHLAERAARSNGQFILITIQHSSIASYSERAGVLAHNEWRKVQGRFADLSFILPIDQVLTLVDSAILQNFLADVRSWFEIRLNRIRLDLPNVNDQRWSTLAGAAPLHPMTTLLLWPVFRSTLAQNERSLFSFLCSHEPYGFSEFLFRTRTDVESNDFDGFYRLDALYDYVVAALGTGLNASGYSIRFAEAETALDRISTTAPLLSSRLVKAVLLLNLFGDRVGLSASHEYLRLAFADGIGVSQSEVDSAIEYLENESILVYRSHLRAFSIWEGSDMKIDELFDKARTSVEALSMHQLLDESIDCPPRIARGHYLRTGSLRYFDVVINAESPDLFWNLVKDSIDRSSADGVIFHLLAASDEAFTRFQRTITEKSTKDGSNRDRPVLFGISRPALGLNDALRDLVAWERIRHTEPKLESDRVARNEVDLRIRAARKKVEPLLGGLLGLPGHEFDPALSRWFLSGEEIHFPNRLYFFHQLSAVCDRAYSSAPPLHNELLNRNLLSSAAAKARRNLLDAMLHNEQRENLGIVGHPPELSMYQSTLAQSGIHSYQGNVYKLASPSDNQWRTTWDEVSRQLTDSSEDALPVPSLFATLARPPYGVRSGPLPVILLAFLLAHRNQVAIYEAGTFVPHWRIEVFERLMRRPSDFSLRWIREDAATLQLLNELQSVRLSDTSSLIDFVRPLIMMVGRLPAYTRQTRRFDDTRVTRVRDTILRAQDPVDLVFKQLPQVLRNGSDDASLSNHEYATTLSIILDALRDAHPRLLREIHQALLDTFSLDESNPRAELAARAKHLIKYGGDRRLKTFLLETQRSTSRWEEGLARVVLDGVPVDQWKDADVVTFHTRLALLARDFFRLEELSELYEMEKHAGVLRIDFLSREHKYTVVPLDAHLLNTDVAEADFIEIRNALDKLSSRLSSRQRLRTHILAKLLIEEVFAQDRD